MEVEPLSVLLAEAAAPDQAFGALKSRKRWSSLSAASTCGDESTSMETGSDSEVASTLGDFAVDREQEQMLAQGADFLDSVQRELGDTLSAMDSGTSEDDMNDIAARLFTEAKVEQLQASTTKTEVVSS